MKLGEENAQLRDVLFRVLAWVDSPEVARLSTIAAVHGFGLTPDECVDGHKALADARDLIENKEPKT